MIIHKNKRQDFRQLALFLFVSFCFYLFFYLSEQRVFGRSYRLQKLFYTDTDLTEQAFSSVERERDVYEIFTIEI